MKTTIATTPVTNAAHGTIDAVAEPKFAGEMDDQPAARELEVARAHTIDEPAIVGRRELARDGFFHVEALAKNQGLR